MSIPALYRFLLILKFLFLTHALLFSQQKACVFTDWSKHYGGNKHDGANDLQQTADGGFIVAGYSRSQSLDVSENFGGSDYWVVKLDSLGEIEWEKNFGGSDNDIATAVLQTPDGGYIVAGGSVSFDVQVSGNHGMEDAWILRLDASGNLLWAKTFGGSLNDRAESISPTADGDYVIAGYSESNDGDLNGNQGDFDYWIFKINANGNLLWSRNYGGSLADFGFDAKQTPDGGYLMAGSTFSSNGNVSGNKGFYDYWIIKLDPNGNLLWQKNFGGAGEERAYSVVLTNDGGAAIAGASNSAGGDLPGNSGSYDYWIIKIDSNGNLVWSRTFGGSAEDRAFALSPSSDGGFLLTGFASSGNGTVGGNYGSRDAWLLKLDADGQLIWEKNFGGSLDDRFYAVIELANGGFTCAGFSTSNNLDLPGNYGEQDLWVVRLSPDTMTISLGNDTTLCAGEGLLLDPMKNGLAYLWPDGSTLPVFLVSSPGTYWVEADKQGCKSRDTILVSYVSETPVNLGQDTILSEGDTLLLDPGIPGASVLWKGGSTDATFPVQTPGSYWVKASKDGCEYRDTISVQFTTVDFNLGQDAFLCEGQTIFLDLTLPNATYRWQDNSTQPRFQVTEPGEYRVTVTQGGCQRSDTLFVEYQQAPDTLLPAVSFICENEAIWFDATQPGTVTYLWQNGSTEPKLKAVAPGNYSVEVTIHGCTFRDELELKPCETCLYVPNIFSPNGDGINDIFQGFAGCEILAYDMKIFDRWGMLVYRGNNPDEGWNGEFRGKKVSQGTYVYLIEFEVLNGGQSLRQVRQGALTLLR